MNNHLDGIFLKLYTWQNSSKILNSVRNNFNLCVTTQMLYQERFILYTKSIIVGLFMLLTVNEEREREREGGREKGDLAHKAALGYHQARIESEYSADQSGVQAISYNYWQRWTGIVPRRTVNRTIGREIETGHATMSTIIFQSQNNALPIAVVLIARPVLQSLRNRRLCFDYSIVKLLGIKIIEVLNGDFGEISQTLKIRRRLLTQRIPCWLRSVSREFKLTIDILLFTEI